MNFKYINSSKDTANLYLFINLKNLEYQVNDWDAAVTFRGPPEIFQVFMFESHFLRKLHENTLKAI